MAAPKKFYDKYDIPTIYRNPLQLNLPKKAIK